MFICKSIFPCFFSKPIDEKKAKPISETSPLINKKWMEILRGDPLLHPSQEPDLITDFDYDNTFIGRHLSKNIITNGYGEEGKKTVLLALDTLLRKPCSVNYFDTTGTHCIGIYISTKNDDGWDEIPLKKLSESTPTVSSGPKTIQLLTLSRHETEQGGGAHIQASIGEVSYNFLILSTDTTSRCHSISLAVIKSSNSDKNPAVWRITQSLQASRPQTPYQTESKIGDGSFTSPFELYYPVKRDSFEESKESEPSRDTAFDHFP
ncbi:MAG: hypothetical protein S4CHLAM7_00300 [Chlamydiae bacterium]|nr:hypothetical protein [Chlamydiota bacterium]